MLPRWRGELEEEASMSMSPLLFRRSFHGRAGLVLFSTMVGRSDRRLFPVCHNAFEPELARVVEDGVGL
jgi:hypothetical protein